VLFPCPFNGLNQPLTCSFGHEKFLVPVATEGKPMGMTRDVVSFAFLFDELPLLHVGDYSGIFCFLKHYSIHFIRFAHSVAATHVKAHCVDTLDNQDVGEYSIGS